MTNMVPFEPSPVRVSPLAVAARPLPGREGYFVTVIVMSVVVDKAPSLAMARSRYVPGSLKRTVVTAWPLVTGIAAVLSKLALPGPAY